jgi:hypothetical protein
MTYTHPYHVGSIYPRGTKLPLLLAHRVWESCNVAPPATSRRHPLPCIQLQAVCCARQHGLFPLLTFDSMIGLHINGRIDIEWKCVCVLSSSSSGWVLVAQTFECGCETCFHKMIFTSRVDPVESWWVSGLGVLYITDQFFFTSSRQTRRYSLHVVLFVV